MLHHTWNKFQGAVCQKMHVVFIQNVLLLRYYSARGKLISKAAKYPHLVSCLIIKGQNPWLLHVHSHGTKELLNLPVLDLKAKHLCGSAYCLILG